VGLDVRDFAVELVKAFAVPDFQVLQVPLVVDLDVFDFD
jgi:hypothetical protein